MNSSRMHVGIMDDKTLCLTYYANIWRIKARGRSMSCADIDLHCSDTQLVNPGSERKTVSKSLSASSAEWTQPCSNPQSLNHILNMLQDRRKSVLEDSFTMANKNWKSQIWIIIRMLWVMLFMKWVADDRWMGETVSSVNSLFLIWTSSFYDVNIRNEFQPDLPLG